MRWTLPNMLTVGRMIALPAIVWLIWPGVEGRESCFWAAVLYAAAGLVDIMDGFVARRTNQVTVVGKFLDPLADKLIYLITLIALLQLPGPRVPTWVVILMLARELAITGLRGIAVSEGIVIAADKGGKMKTTFATVGVCALLVHYPYVFNFGVTQAYIDPHPIGLWFTYLSAILAITSGYNYVRGFLRAVRGGAHGPA